MARKTNQTKLKERIEKLVKLQEKKQANYEKAAALLSKRQLTLEKLNNRILYSKTKVIEETAKPEMTQSNG